MPVYMKGPHGLDNASSKSDLPGTVLVGNSNHFFAYAPLDLTGNAATVLPTGAQATNPHDTPAVVQPAPLWNHTFLGNSHGTGWLELAVTASSDSSTILLPFSAARQHFGQPATVYALSGNFACNPTAWGPSTFCTPSPGGLPIAACKANTCPTPPPSPPSPPPCFQAGCVPDGIRKNFAKTDCCNSKGRRDASCKGSHWICD